MCRKKAMTLHEIIPKSKAPKTWREDKNRVPLCVVCHDRVHMRGAGNYADILRFLRDRALRLYDSNK